MDFNKTLQRLQEAAVKDVNFKDEKELDSLEADEFQGNKKVKILSKDKQKKKAKVIVGTKQEIDKMDVDKAQLANQLGLRK